VSLGQFARRRLSQPKIRRMRMLSPLPLVRQRRRKSTHAASHRKRAKAKETDEAIPAPTEFHSRRNTEDQRSVRHRGGREQRQNLIRKKCGPNTTACEHTKTAKRHSSSRRVVFLDRPVTVQPTDTMAEPVKLNIKAGDTYQRIDLLRALLVEKSQ